MFESAELDHTLNKKAFHDLLPALREALLDMQLGLLQSRQNSP